MDKITKAQIQAGSKGDVLSGLLYIVELKTKETSTGSTYALGTALSKEGQFPFKQWGFNKETSLLKAGACFNVHGRVDEYNGTKSFIINGVDNEVLVDVSEFESSLYDKDTLVQEFRSVLTQNLSKEGLQIFKLLLGDNVDNFFNEYAARRAGKNHDNVRHGLLAHSLKVTKVLEFAWELYGLDECDLDKDLMFIGVSLHDMGKVQEYLNGEMSKNGQLVSHRSFATETLALNRETIISIKGEDWYYRLMSIFAQHHGEYEEKPRTFQAMFTHLIDSFEASFAGLLAIYENREPGTATWHHGFALS